MKRGKDKKGVREGNREERRKWRGSLSWRTGEQFEGAQQVLMGSYRITSVHAAHFVDQETEAQRKQRAYRCHTGINSRSRENGVQTQAYAAQKPKPQRNLGRGVWVK